jgi:hypothetical protein
MTDTRDGEMRCALNLGPQLLAVFFGGRDCGFCRSEDFKKVMRPLARSLSDQARRAQFSFHYLGVAVDWSASKGVEYLGQLGEFDEISAGAKWLNTVVAARLFGVEKPIIPSLVLYTRMIEQVGETLVFSPEKELLRLIGAKEIVEWIDSGAPIESLLLA